MAGDAQATRRRLLSAARDEFAEHGIAGARVDRIAVAARSNKAQIYHYFGSKDDLFDAVFHELVLDTVRETPLDATDLPGYAARLFDRFEERPQIARLATWYQLERAEGRPPVQARVASNKEKIARIAKAQKAGDLPSTYAAADLLALVVTIASMWTAMGPEFVTTRQSRAHRRRVVTTAVEAVLAA
ncbi:MAG TPA: TetR family transcriptional regulator [Solirubrobacteraceae bacterium]|nr:TetR family transcriptional regulator [Solirubrobacteraceae bacterium]